MEFRGYYAFLSNFYRTSIAIDGIIYPTAEHAFQSYKSDEHEYKLEVSRADKPSDAKKIGRRIKLIPDWNEKRVDYMRLVVGYKFNQNNDLRDMLIATANTYLIEDNYWHDNFWGNCKCSKCYEPGFNMLGKILMELRESYLKGGQG